MLSDKGYLISNAESALEEEGAAKALELTLAHYADPVAQDIGLVHIVRSQNNDAIFLVRFEHVPEVTAGTEIHASSWFVKEDQLRITAE